jgi:hypothetical protein
MVISFFSMSIILCLAMLCSSLGKETVGPSQTLMLAEEYASSGLFVLSVVLIH